MSLSADNLSPVPKGAFRYSVIGAICGWVAIILQLYLIIINRTTSIPETIIRFFSFFTILVNILAALCYTYVLYNNQSRWSRFFSRTTIITAVTVYIIVVGTVYNIILRYLWEPQGLQKLVDELLHTVNPLLFVIYWLAFIPKKTLRWNNVFPWLIFPLVYLLFIITRGWFSGYYPYPFIDASAIGYSTLIVNCFVLLVVFLGLSLLLIGIAKLTSNKNKQLS